MNTIYVHDIAPHNYTFIVPFCSNIYKVFVCQRHVLSHSQPFVELLLLSNKNVFQLNQFEHCRFCNARIMI
jgi:hypothetical protein